MTKPKEPTDMAADLAAAIDPTNYPGIVLREEVGTMRIVDGHLQCEGYGGPLYAPDGHEVTPAELASLQDAGKVIFRMPANHRDDEPAPRLPAEPGDDLVLLGEETGRLPPLVRPDEELPPPLPPPLPPVVVPPAPESIPNQDIGDASREETPPPTPKGLPLGGGLYLREDLSSFVAPPLPEPEGPKAPRYRGTGHDPRVITGGRIRKDDGVPRATTSRR
jgi:hypothetical protein